MKKKNDLIIPVIVFTITLILGLLAVLIAEQTQKAKLTTRARAYNYDDDYCGTHTTSVEVSCGVANQGKQTCQRTYHYLKDIKEDCQVFDNPERPTVACYQAGWEDGTCTPCSPPPEDRTPPPDNSPTPTTPPTATPTTVLTNTPTPTKPATVTPSTPVTNTPTPTSTSTPTPTKTPTNTPIPSATPTPAPNACGYTQCDSQHPCNSGLICVTAKNDKSYCAKPDYQDACKNNPSYDTCCRAPGAACGYTQCDDEHPCQSGLVCVTAKNDKSYCSKPELQDACKNNNGSYSACCSNPTPTEVYIAKGPTNTPPATPTIPSAGVTQWAFLAIPFVIIALGLLF